MPSASDFRHAARALLRSPLLTCVAVGSLAIGIGATTAVFSIVNALLFRPLPYRDSDRLVDVYEHHPVEVCSGCGVGTSRAVFEDLRRARSFEALATYRTRPATVVTPEGAERVRAASVSPALFAVLGLEPLTGRTFAEGDAAGGAAPVMLLSERLQRVRPQGSAEVGATMRIDGVQRTVIGVVPEHAAFPAFTDVWLPLDPDVASDRTDRGWGVVARLAPGASVESARTEAAAFATRFERAYLADARGWTLHVDQLHETMAADYAGSFRTMFGIVVFVLLVACANVANLLIARAAARRHELAVRAALGASSRALGRHVLAESLLVSAAAGALGLLVAAWSLELFSRVTAGALPSWVQYGLDLRVAFFALALALATGFVFGLLPARQARRVDLAAVLAESARTGVSPGRARVRRALVVVQLAAAVVLVFGALYLTSEFLRVSRFVADRDVAGQYGGRVTLPPGVDPAAAARELVPQVQVAAQTNDIAFSSLYVPNWPGTPRVQLRAEDRTTEATSAALHRVLNVTPGFFMTNAVAILRGRSFTDADAAGAPGVAVIGAALAARLWPDQDPLGRRIHLGGPGDDWLTIVGVAHSDRASPFARDTARILYVPLAQHAVAAPVDRELGLHVRLRPGAAAEDGLARRLRAAVAAVDPAIVLEEVRSERAANAQWIAPVRASAGAATALGAFAAVLAAMGIYGVIAYLVTQRTSEIGIRMALGSTRRAVAWLVLRESLSLVALGLLAGSVGALSLNFVLRSQLVGAGAPGPALLVLLPSAFIALGLAATWLPARRAARIDPMSALRVDQPGQTL